MKIVFLFIYFYRVSILYTNTGFCLPSVYPGENRNVREILSNLIGYLGDWKLEKTAKSRKIGFEYRVLIITV